jgi:SRSO17 transposase
MHPVIEVSNGVLPNYPRGVGGDRTNPAKPVAKTKAEGAADLDIVCPRRWGLPDEAIDDLADRLLRTWSRFGECFKTKTRDGSQHAWVYLKGLLTMKIKRNIANIACGVIDQDDDGQNLQQFISDSPWSSQGVFDQIQAELCQRPELHGGMLTVDESADECSGAQKAGAGRQYLGREGKVDVGVVGVGIGYYKNGTWSLVDAGLYLPETWFNAEHATLRRRWHVPAERVFMTKPQMALHMILAAKAKGMPFEVVGCDSLYGRDSQF